MGSSYVWIMVTLGEQEYRQRYKIRPSKLNFFFLQVVSAIMKLWRCIRIFQYIFLVQGQYLLQ
jgi:hypothetical protein